LLFLYYRQVFKISGHYPLASFGKGVGHLFVISSYEATKNLLRRA
jgi:hypothetical protein